MSSMYIINEIFYILFFLLSLSMEWVFILGACVIQIVHFSGASWPCLAYGYSVGQHSSRGRLTCEELITDLDGL